MKKYLLLIVGLVFAGVTVKAETGAMSTIQEGSTGTVSATVYVRPSDGNAHITDVSYKIDAANTSPVIAVYPGQKRFLVSSPTATSGTQTIWFDNSSSAVAQGDYVILSDVSTINNYLYRAVAVSSTGVQVGVTLSAATTTSDILYTTKGRLLRPTSPQPNSTTIAPVDIWLPSGVPSAIAVDGNTTSCSIFISGVRTKDSN